MRLFQLLKDIILAIRNISNKYYYTSGTASGTYGATFVLCALSDLPKGVYLVQGHVNGGKDLSSVAMAADIYIPTGGTVLMAGGSRTTMIAGGGCTCWGLIEVTEKNVGEIQLRTYRYYSGSITYTGKLVAVRLI